LLAEPLGHSRPREIGLSGLPSIWTTFSSLTYTFWAQPTAQNGHTECATWSASAVRGVNTKTLGLSSLAATELVVTGQLLIDRP
jgi:hypothetical protein